MPGWTERYYPHFANLCTLVALYGKCSKANLIDKIQMKRLFYFLFFVSIFPSCKQDYKRCEFQTNDSFLKVYNDILKEIITKRAYNIYLGEDEEKIFKRYAKDIGDSNNIEIDVIKLHNKLFADSSRLCTIYLDTLLRPTFRPWSYLKQDTNIFSRTIVNLISEFPKDSQDNIDFLNSIQTKYSSTDFQVCIAKIKSVRELSTDTPKCYIGKISFSKLILNQAKDKGLLCYEFRCGGLCGYGSLILIEKINNDWIITESITTWIS